MTGDTYIKALAALFAWREERNNGINGMLSMLFVLRNRVQTGWSGGNLPGVVEDALTFQSQHDPARDGLFPDIREPEFQRILQLADEVFDNNLLDNLTGGACYFADLNRTENQTGWFLQNILKSPDKHPRTAQVGKTTYFK